MIRSGSWQRADPSLDFDKATPLEERALHTVCGCIRGCSRIVGIRPVSKSNARRKVTRKGYISSLITEESSNFSFRNVCFSLSSFRSFLPESYCELDRKKSEISGGIGDNCGEGIEYEGRIAKVMEELNSDEMIVILNNN